jgi:hypothetical protein
MSCSYKWTPPRHAPCSQRRRTERSCTARQSRAALQRSRCMPKRSTPATRLQVLRCCLPAACMRIPLTGLWRCLLAAAATACTWQCVLASALQHACDNARWCQQQRWQHVKEEALRRASGAAGTSPWDAGSLQCSCEPAAAVRSIRGQHGVCTFTLAATAPEGVPELVLRAQAGPLSAFKPVRLWQLAEVSVRQHWLFNHPDAILRPLPRHAGCSGDAPEYDVPQSGSRLA